VESLILVVLLGIFLIMAGTVVAVLLVARALRRRWIAFRSGAMGYGMASAISVASERLPRRRPTAISGVTGWSPPRARREMWRSVEAATAAVRVAERSGAAVGDLPVLCRRLHEVAASLDELLRVEPAQGSAGAAPGATSLRDQVGVVLRSAADVQHTAVLAASAAQSPRVSTLQRDMADEIDCVVAGAGQGAPPGLWPG